MAKKSFGIKLNNLFKKSYAHLKKGKSSDREEYYFKALIEAFTKVGKNSYAKELHGTKHLVQFTATKPADKSRTTGRCELADIMLICFSNTPKLEIRLTFIQAKRESTAPSPQKLSANLEQWDLLHNRPYITSASKGFRVNARILSNAKLRSVGSFFYFHNDKGTPKGFYSSAAELSVTRTYNQRYGSVSLASAHQIRPGVLSNHTSQVLRTIKGASMQETTYAPSINKFGDEVMNLTLGTPIILGGRPVSTELLQSLTDLVSDIQKDDQNEVIKKLAKELIKIESNPIRKTKHMLRSFRSLIVVSADEDP